MPFVDEEYEDLETDYIPRDDYSEETRRDIIRDFLKRDDKRFFLIGGAAALITFVIILYIMYSSSKPVDINELPVIHADTTPIKIKPPRNGQVSHQDKIVYDNISGDSREVVEKTAPPPEEILSINEIDSNEVLSAKEKKDIIKAFDNLAPEKEYKINYVKSGASSPNSGKVEAVEEAPPIKQAQPDESRKIGKASEKTHKKKISDLINKKKATPATSDDDDVNLEKVYGDPAVQKGGSIMLQIASLPTKAAAESEYKRIARKNRWLKQLDKRIDRVDLGKKKGITFRVKVGPFRDKADAQKVMSSLKQKGFPSYISR